MYFIYILTNYYNTVLYIGCTHDLLKRLREHKDLPEKHTFSNKYNLNKLIYYEILPNRETAYQREKQLKNWHRQWKINLIDKHNETWKDLQSQFLKDLRSK